MWSGSVNAGGAEGRDGATGLEGHLRALALSSELRSGAPGARRDVSSGTASPAWLPAEPRRSPVHYPHYVAPADMGGGGDNLIVNYLPPSLQEHQLRVRGVSLCVMF